MVSWGLAKIGSTFKELNDAEVMVLIVSPKIVWFLQILEWFWWIAVDYVKLYWVVAAVKDAAKVTEAIKTVSVHGM